MIAVYNSQQDLSKHSAVPSVRFTLVHYPNPSSYHAVFTASEVDSDCHHYASVHEAFSPLEHRPKEPVELLNRREETCSSHAPHI